MFTFSPGKLLIVIIIFYLTPFVGLKAQSCTDSVIINKDFKGHSEKQNFKIKSAHIKNNLLMIEVNVCKKNKKNCFCIVTTGMYAESFPPQLEVNLTQHKSVKCKKEKYRTKQLSFNISKLKYKGSKELVLKLRDYSGRLIYTYN